MRKNMPFIDQVPISFLPNKKWAYLRELKGEIEQQIKGTGTQYALKLVDSLLADTSNRAITSGEARKLTVSDRDRILAAIYINTYGPKVEATVTCSYCGLLFDLDFSLKAMTDDIYQTSGVEYEEIESICVFHYQNKIKFRLPTGEDELTVIGLEPSEAEFALFERCIVKENPKVAKETLPNIMEEIGPLIKIGLDAQCPECGKKQLLHFDIQQYLLSALMQEQSQLIFEVHQLALAYGWSLQEILSIPRNQRRQYVSLLE